MTPNTCDRFLILAAVLLLALPAAAQELDHSSFVPDVTKRVVLDPTTYAPAILAWTATHFDWRSSQIFFQNGFAEGNSRFTVSGRSGDTPLRYVAGNRRILLDAFANLEVSVVNNVTSQVLDRVLRRRFPNHRKLVGSIGWIERSSMASYWSYRQASGHLRQWQNNERNSRLLGF